MPRAYDRGTPLADFDPLVSKLFWDIGDMEQTLVDALLASIEKFIDDVIDAIEQATGVDLTVWIALVHADFAALEELFGELNPLSGEFNPAGAITTLFNLAVTTAALAPDLLTSIQLLCTIGVEHLLVGFILSPGGETILGQLITAMGGVGNTLEDLNVIFIDFNENMTSLGVLFGELNPLSGTFNPVNAAIHFFDLIVDLIEEAPELASAIGDIVNGVIGAYLTIDGWTDFLAGAIGALGGTGSTALRFIAALEAIPGGNIMGALSNATLAGADLTGNVAAALVSGVLALGSIPSLTNAWTGHVASELISGVLAVTAIPALTAGWAGSIAASLLTGTLTQDTIPSLTAGWGRSVASSLLTGVLDVATIPALTIGWGKSIASGLLTGVLDIARIPALTAGWAGTVASSLLTGTIGAGLIPDITKAMSSDMRSMITTFFGGSVIGSVLVTDVIPNLPASIINSGTFLLAQIPNLPASIINSGTFAASMITGALTNATIAGSKISSLLSASVIPSLTAGWSGTISSNLLSGVLALESIPELAISAINGLGGYLSTLFGPFNPVQLLGIGQVAAAPQNLLLNPTLDSADSLVGESIWTWDADKHSATGGSAKVLASVNGVVKSLLGNPIQVTSGQSIQASAWTKWSSLSYTGTPIALMLNVYDSADTLIAEVSLQAAAMTGATSGWVQLSGTYVTTGSAAWVRLRFNVDVAATAGSVWFGDASLVKPQLLQQSFVANLETDIAASIAKIEAGWKAAVNTFLPGISQVNPLADFQNALNSAGAQIASAASQVTSALGLLNIRDNLPIHFGLGATHETTIALAHLGTGATPANFSVTASTPAMGFIRCGTASLKKWIVWHGAGRVNVSEFYIAIYRMDTTTGDMTRIHLSANVVSIVSAGWNWNAYEIPDGIQVLPSDVLGVELRTVGSGTHTIGGVNLAWMSTTPYPGFPKHFGACRNSSAAAPSSIATASVQYSDNVPFFSIGMDAGDVPSTDVPAQRTDYAAPGDYAVPIQPWAVLIDLVGCGGGGAGGSGNDYGIPVWVSGSNGGNGSWNATTLVRGEHIPWDATVLYVHVGGGAGYTPGTPGGGYNGAGGDSTRFTASGFGGLTCNGGGGGGIFYGINSGGGGNTVGNIEFPASSGQIFYGGSQGYAGGNAGGAVGSWGNAPGGGGGGGCTGSTWPITGGYGAGGQHGCATVIQRQI